MPITIHNNKLQVKKDNSYINIDAIADETTEERITEINAAATNAINTIEQKELSISNMVNILKSDDIFEVLVPEQVLNIKKVMIFDKQYSNHTKYRITKFEHISSVTEKIKEIDGVEQTVPEYIYDINLTLEGKSGTNWVSIGTLSVEESVEDPTVHQTIKCYKYINQTSNDDIFYVTIDCRTLEDVSYTNQNYIIKNGIVNNTDLPFVTPEMFGAVGDGVTNDTSAWEMAVSIGKDVKAANKKYYITREIEVTKNISIDCNMAEFIYNGIGLFRCVGKVKAYTYEAAPYRADRTYLLNKNQASGLNGASGIPTDYRNYTGFAMFQGRNNFDESRTGYLGGFVCTFHKGRITQTYPIDVDGIAVQEGGTTTNVFRQTYLEFIDPITVNIANIGQVSITSNTADIPKKEEDPSQDDLPRMGGLIEIKYGYNCTVKNVSVSDASNTLNYMIISLTYSLNCTCDHITVLRYFDKPNSTTGNRYINYPIAFAGSSYCTVQNSYLYNDNWHCITTVGTYLTYSNTIDNCVLLVKNHIAFCEHENGVGTRITNSTLRGLFIGALGYVHNVRILSFDESYKECWMRIAPPTNPRLAGATISDVTFSPDTRCGTQTSSDPPGYSTPAYPVCGIKIDCDPQQPGKTFYVDNIDIRNIKVENVIYTDPSDPGTTRQQINKKFWFGFHTNAFSKERTFNLRKINFDNCQLDIDLDCRPFNSNTTVDTTAFAPKQSTYELMPFTATISNSSSETN